MEAISTLYTCQFLPNLKHSPSSRARCSTISSSHAERLVSERYTSSSGGLLPMRNLHRKPVLPRAMAEGFDETPLQVVEAQVLPVEETVPSFPSTSSSSQYSLDLANNLANNLDLANNLANNLANEVQVLAAATTVEAQPETGKMVDRLLNAALVGGAVAYALGKILTVDQDYWHGWTFYEIIKYAPVHNWSAYEKALESHPVLAKMMISGIVYSVGDWMAQCYEGKPVLDFNRTRMLRSGLVGFCLHGSLSHFYYHFCEFLFPYKEWWVVPLKVGFDQTIWSAFWNSVYFVTLGFLRLENPVTIFSELRATFFPLLTAGWKLWPFAHLVTYGLVPLEQRLLWVDCVELVWVTILSMYSNVNSEARMLEEDSSSTKQ